MFTARCPGAFVGLGAVVAVAAAAAAAGQWGYVAVSVVTAVGAGLGAYELYRGTAPRQPGAPAPAKAAPSPPANDLVAIIGPDGTLEQVSESTGEALALPTGRLFGLDVMRLVHPEDRGHLVGMVIEAEQQGESSPYRMRFVRGDRTWATFDVWALALPETGGGTGDGGAIMIGRSVPEPGRRAAVARVAKAARPTSPPLTVPAVP